MLSLITALCLLGIGMVSGDNYTMPNYFVDAYEGNTAYYAYPLDLCLQTGLLDSENVIYSCSEDGTEVTKSIYEETDCTQLQSNETFTEETVWDNGRYDFNCDGVTSYVELFVCPSSDTCSGCLLGGATTYSVMGVCNYGGNGTSILSTYGECDEESAAITAYPDSLTCSENTTNTTVLSATGECGYFTAITDPFAITIYAEMVSCTIDGIKISPTVAPTVAPALEPTAQPVTDAAVSIKPLFSFVIVIAFASWLCK